MNRSVSTTGFLFNKTRLLWNSPLRNEFLLLALSSVALHGTGFIIRLVGAGIVGPEKYGLWNILNLILVYGGIVHLGVLNAMNRDVPICKGKNDLAQMEAIRQTSLGVMFLSTGTACIMLLLFSFYFGESPIGMPLRAMALLFASVQIITYIQVYLKSDKRFNKFSFQQFALAVALPVMVIPLTMLYGLTGFIAGQSLAMLAVVPFVILLNRDVRLRPRFDILETKRLMKVGFPILAVALLHSLMITADRWIAVSFLGVEQLGYYSLAIIAIAALQLAPRTVSQQIYPRMAETYGRTSSYTALKIWVVRHVAASLVITIPLVVVTYFVLPVIVYRYLPDYIPGITAVRIILLGLIFMPLWDAFAIFLITIDKQVYTMIVQAFALLVNVVLNITFVRMGLGINGIALGTALTYVIYSLGLFAVMIFFMRREPAFIDGDSS